MKKNSNPYWISIILAAVISPCFAELTQTDQPPMVPVGLDSYLMWDKLPYHRIGIRAYLRSMYDRRGGNEGADSSHYLYQQADDFNVALHVEGQPGILYFMRTNHWHGSPWHYEIDRIDTIVKETATDDPLNAKKILTIVKATPFSMAEFKFYAEKDTPYAIWVRGKNIKNNGGTDALWMQFDDDIGTDTINSTYYHEKGFGNWLDKYPNNTYGWSIAPDASPKIITFENTGVHKLRIQPRHGEHMIDQIWLSATRLQHPDFLTPVDFKDDISNIVLNVQDARNITGDVEIVLDKDAYHGKAILMPKPKNFAVFIPQDLFPYPLTWTWGHTNGSDLMWVPLAFDETLRIAHSRTCYGAGYFIYHLMTAGMNNLSRPLKAWTKQPPDSKVLDLLKTAGTDIAPVGQGVTKYAGDLDFQPLEWTTVKKIKDAPATIRALKFTIPRERAYDFGQSRLRITWDHRWHSSVDVPLALFFGTGRFHNNNDREYLVKGFPINVRYDAQNVYLGFYYPMPFFEHAKIEIQNHGKTVLPNVKYEIRTTPFTDPVNTVGYFHATYSDHPHPENGLDMVFLDTTKTEGGGDWSGSFVGMSWIFSHDGDLQTLEGDPRFFFDDSQTPQGLGAGTEDWGGGGDYWGGENMTLPLAGHPVGTRKNKALNEKDLINSAYRFLIADIFPFGKNAKITFEHGGLNQSKEHYEFVAYWYGMDKPTLVMTDMLNVCSQKSITAHNYISPTDEPSYTLVSRYELGVDTGSESELFFPAQEDNVRCMKGTSTFELNINKDNLGVMLRRKFDYSYPNQKAKVYVRSAGSSGDWNYAGTWFTAGSNTCYFSRPKGELDSPTPLIRTSNRCWREEEFLISPKLTRNTEKLAVKIEWIADDRYLLGTTPYPKTSAWSAARYWAYCYQMPTVLLEY